ncbi:class F sortase [Blastococcus sp. CCUG 61487]|uniref:class F sortase n=1 Tax=Blastococcus sp. CCUG 61487 TaxID=1840703 RepID=UPI00113629AF|nr:class F sortase [Blastococcus sp. CCUG 61487]TKJ18651.1 hypothetical protein A6V29_11330 [Blastococcus sp. CCUG 61487]
MTTLLLAVVAALLLGQGTAAADEPGRLRIAHLSPDTPAVDVALTPAPASGPAADPGPDVATALQYGDVGEYLELAAGAYAVSVRPAGSPADTSPALSTRVQLPAGGVRTLALSGPFADLALTELTDEPAPAGAATARVRVVAAAAGAPVVDVAVDDGPLLAADLAFPGAGDHVLVDAGPLTLRLAGGGTDTTVSLDLEAGTVVSLLVVDAPDGGLTVQPVVDAAAPARVPVGGVEAGGGLPSSASTAEGAVPAVPLAAAPAVPVRLRMPAVGIDASVAPTGLGAGGDLAVPAAPELAGWYAGGPAPGERGPAVLTGHVDWGGLPAVLHGLAGAAPGDEVVVDRADGTSVRFTVTRVAQVPKTAFPTGDVYGPVPGAELRLITCGGRFDRATGSYADNVVVFARLG